MKKELTKNFLMVSMDEVKISDNEKYIIGTQALATCVGVLVYSKEHKKTIVAHVSGNIYNTFDAIIRLILENNLDTSKLEYKVIQGYYINHYNIKEDLEELFKTYNMLFSPLEYELKPGDIVKDIKTPSKEFAFDALNGKFVTNKVLFGIDYINYNKTHKKA